MCFNCVHFGFEYLNGVNACSSHSWCRITAVELHVWNLRFFRMSVFHTIVFWKKKQPLMMGGGIINSYKIFVFSRRAKLRCSNLKDHNLHHKQLLCLSVMWSLQGCGAVLRQTRVTCHFVGWPIFDGRGKSPKRSCRFIGTKIVSAFNFKFGH